MKIVSGNDPEALETVASLYELIIDAGVHRAESIRVAEATKVIENAQRDINIAFMNELSMLFNEMDIDTNAVLRSRKRSGISSRSGRGLLADIASELIHII